MHISVPLDQSIEFINVTQISPLISKCQIKVCYVGEEPNRNRTIITKEVATELGKNLPGSPIVGYFNKDKKDFEEHNRELVQEDGKWSLVDTTKPYGFVDINAKVWFQKFLDDGEVEREYLVTEGYIWTEAYPEAKRIIEKGNNQSMELNNESVKGKWAKTDNSKDRFFIINEALIEKLCILGENVEPCFEGAQIKTEFSLENEINALKENLFSMINEVKKVLNEGGNPVITTYAVEIGDSLWCSLHMAIAEAFPWSKDRYVSAYYIHGIYEEEGQKFAVLKSRDDAKLYRVDFVYDEAGLVLNDAVVEVAPSFTPVEQFALEDIEAFEYAEKTKKKEEEEEQAKDEEDNSEETSEEEPAADEEQPAEEDEEEEEDKKKKQYSLEEIVEYTELQHDFEELTTSYSALVQERDGLQEQLKVAQEELSALKEFKLAADRKEKEELIQSFYMLSDEDKADVVANIDNYSLDDIEAKLAIICFRNKVNFNLDDEADSNEVIYNVNTFSHMDSTPDWVKAVEQVASTM